MKVVITSPVNHDGNEYDAGDVVDMPKAQAEQLIAGGAAIGESTAKQAKALKAAEDKLDAAQEAFVSATTDEARAKAQAGIDAAKAEIEKLNA